MKTFLIIVFLTFEFVLSRDFYMGMFKPDDFLVAQDNVFKPRRPYSYTNGEYGRFFKCPITYFRVVDRLGVRGGTTTTIVRGGLLKKYITVRFRSCYNCPISVNIYVGCENKKTTPVTTPIAEGTTASKLTGNDTGEATTGANKVDGNGTNADGGGNDNGTVADAAPAPAAAETTPAPE